MPLDAAATVRPGREDKEVKGLPVPAGGQKAPNFPTPKGTARIEDPKCAGRCKHIKELKLKQLAGMPE